MKFTVFVLLLLSITSLGQTTAFNFQGRLNDGSSPANGHYDLQFKLYDAITGGNRVGPMVSRPDLVLINGVFSTTLDFGAASFNSGDLFLEMSVRPAGSPNAHIVLGARQQILSVPFAIRSAFATQAHTSTNADHADSASDASALGGIPASNYPRLNFANTGNFQINGNVGIGSAAPTTRLTLSDGPAWTSSQWTAPMNVQNGSALGWEPNGSGQRFGIGQTNGGLYFFRTFAAPGQTIPPASVDLQIADSGNLAQPNNRYGVMKGMVAVTGDGSLARCYDGVTGSSTCSGFSAAWETSGGDLICVVIFPFQVNNRFWIVTPDTTFEGLAATLTATAGSSFNNQNAIRVLMRANGSQAQKPFHLFIF